MMCEYELRTEDPKPKVMEKKSLTEILPKSFPNSSSFDSLSACQSDIARAIRDGYEAAIKRVAQAYAEYQSALKQVAWYEQTLPELKGLTPEKRRKDDLIHFIESPNPKPQLSPIELELKYPLFEFDENS